MFPGGGGGEGDALSGPHSPCPFFSRRDPHSTWVGGSAPSPGGRTTQPRCSLLHTLFRERPRGSPSSRRAGRSPTLLASEPPGRWCHCAQATRRSRERVVGSVSGAHPELASGWAVRGWEPRAPPVYFVRSQALQVSSAVAGIGCGLKDGGSQVIPPCGTWGARYGGARPVVTLNRGGSRKPGGAEAGARPASS